VLWRENLSVSKYNLGDSVSYIPKTISEVALEYINRTTFLPAIQREYVWDTDGIEKLFDSIMGNYPIGSFLFWKIREEKKSLWTAYKFFSNFDKESPHNEEANLAGIKQDIYLVLDGQQRLTSLYLGLKGSYRFFYYNWKKTQLYLKRIGLSKAISDPYKMYRRIKNETISPWPGWIFNGFS
jgi:uncharacterized protein with ParB-like and HNH nuclease domain